MENRKQTENRDALTESVLEYIKRYDMIHFGDRIVIGLSGGPDSVCLIHVLAELRPALGIRSLHAVHVNHGLRGGESDRDQAYAETVARGLGATFDAVRYDVAAMAEEQCAGEEEMGRRLRYAAFEIYREKYGAQRIAVAHNRNDQAETVLMRIIRGTGIRGLAGMAPARADGVIIRPLLGVRRSEIEAYCRSRGLEPRTDSTNLKPVYTRNRIRLNLIPLMENEYNPGLQDALVRLADQAEETDDFMRRAAVSYLDGNENSGKPRWNAKDASLNTDGFADLHPALGRRVILEILDRAGAADNVTAGGIERAARAAASKHEPVEADINDGCYARKVYGKLWLLRRDENEKKAVPEPVPLPVNELKTAGEAEISAGSTRIRLTLVNKEKRQGYKKENDRAFLDFDRLTADGTPVFRNRRPGDRFRPVGMLGRKKLQDYFTDRKVPRQNRDTVILLALGQEVFLAGGEVSGSCAVTADTSHVLVIEYSK